ncbi:MAG: YeeE/YedE thiosulfate transporter family protein [Gammaproteobacteria bacterium]|nr:YeeE/YedE thiosulfate transporter family protein [Gammaproteobacteria bacterium]
MDLIAPLAKTGLITQAQNLWLAIPTGFLLGVALQLAGFTDGRKIGRAFYFNDTDVPIVMFSAIITGMLGLWGLSLIGFLDISKVYFLPTYLYPVMVGGILFGIGMVIGGYCPGTALASIATGKLDALMFLVGFFIGSLLFGDLYPIWETFYKSDYRGVIRLDHWFDTTIGGAILIMVVISIGVSLLLRLGQHLVWRNLQPTSSLFFKSTQYTLVGLALLTAVVMAFFPNSAFIPSESADDSFYMVPRPIFAEPGSNKHIKAD